jgi:methylphosphotriester-DNA--protein-cysteine methyltransferase
MSYRLTGTDGRPFASEVKGQWGGYKPTKIYGRLGCQSAMRAIARGGYARHRVFFASEATAIAAGYRPCGVCCPSQYSAWKAAQQTPSAPSERKRWWA